MVEINTYRTKEKACRATSLRSRNLVLKGKCSQLEVRQLGEGGCVGGPQGELALRFPGWKIIAQYSEGYRV